ncbi:MAG: nucleotide exchange factor GrpE, partial [Planctomycetota bacterium]
RAALARLREDLARARATATSGAEAALIEALDALRRGRAATEEVRRRLGWRAWLLPRGLLGGLLEGYAMAARRLERTLEALGVREMLCAGERFDPHRMKAVETEIRGDLPEGQVIEVVRPGFVKGDRILRYAEVRTAVREAPAGAGGPPLGSRQG